MSKALKWSILAFVIVLTGIILSHGVVVPRVIWEPRLQSLKNQYPDQRIDAKRVVLALSLNPQLIVSEIEIDDPTRKENVRLALLRLGINAVESVKRGRLLIDAITLKGLAAQSEKQGDCSSPKLDCTPVLPLALAARGWQSTQVANPGFFTPLISLKKLNIEQAVFAVSNPQTQQLLSGQLEQFKFELGNSADASQLSLGWRLSAKAPEIDNQLYVSMSAQPEQLPGGELKLNKIKLDIDGQWHSFPWTGTAEQDQLVLTIEQTNSGEGAPFVKLNGENLRTYIRRDDLPETHQAAFSVRQFEGGLPAQDWVLNKAEWTYTHEDAQAWTFNLNYDAEKSLLNIAPETIEGSEGIPAEAQVREMNCDPDETLIREDKPYWVWQVGWFRVLNNYPKDKFGVVLCPIQQPSAGDVFTGTGASPAGK
ncbi:hypothetical protein [Limnobacter sp.]|uniref:hypothetical protein n=1 Tax=Limnobacter sp. TaxID=2003368 RepID=UPI0027367EEC|nr:hypothetical protein [Limnobacter sp.]MDP3188053.1 hypothetical protein [Limnobacter sp.]